ncbi:hypothetical protein HRI_000744100 [Hibiscus trionum]|uniref:Reverse transcriptase n=1 Tax=Hibiscus trionum TaxID=183268 RepID=A0A9W7H5D9_HIBTR|nr:hypothetical protein HRI_000744100 [Hibiscus trionum]
MERLGHSIPHSIDSRNWSPFKLARHGSPISHLFFANDLILYARADVNNAINVERILNCFGKFSGHCVNKKKTTIFFSPNTNVGLQQAISDRLGFHVVTSFGKYLGTPILHVGVSNDRFDFFIDKIQSCLEGWSAKHLSFMGRVTLVKSILLRIPSYLMQTITLPSSVCSTIEKIVRRFIWGSSATAKLLSLIN